MVNAWVAGESWQTFVTFQCSPDAVINSQAGVIKNNEKVKKIKLSQCVTSTMNQNRMRRSLRSRKSSMIESELIFDMFFYCIFIIYNNSGAQTIWMGQNFLSTCEEWSVVVPVVEFQFWHRGGTGGQSQVLHCKNKKTKNCSDFFLLGRDLGPQQPKGASVPIDHHTIMSAHY